MVVWRICAFEDVAHAFDGEGARLYGGRWNQKGTRLIYTSSTLSLAALETLVHTEPALLKRRRFQFRVEIADALIESLSTPLPANWRDHPAPEATKDLGTEWTDGKRALALSVPSAVIPEERNLLLDPLHPAFQTLAVSKGEPFSFAPRLWRASGKTSAP